MSHVPASSLSTGYPSSQGLSFRPSPSPPPLQVILPVAPDTQVPEGFFERTGADVKAEYLRLAKSRELAGQFCTR